MVLEVDSANQAAGIEFSSINVHEIRYLIIGNSELKLRLMNNHDFLRWMCQQLSSSHTQLMETGKGEGKEKFSLAHIDEMHEIIVIMWLMFLAERTSADKVDVTGLGNCVTQLMETVEFILKQGLRSLELEENDLDTLKKPIEHNESIEPIESDTIEPIESDTVEPIESDTVDDTIKPPETIGPTESIKSIECWKKSMECLSYSFFIMLSFENHLNMLTKYISTARLWQIPMHIISSLDKNMNVYSEECMSAALRLIPLLLDRDESFGAEDGAEKNTVTILYVIFKELRKRISSSWSYLDEPSEKINLHYNASLMHTLFPHSGSTSLTALLVAAAQILNALESNPDFNASIWAKIYNFKERAFFDSLLALYGPKNSDLLNVALLNICRIYLTRVFRERTPDETAAISTFENLFPRINWILKTNTASFENFPRYIRRPITVLSDLCLTYPEACIRIKNSNVDLRVMTDLNKLFSTSKGFKYLHDMKLKTENGKKIVDCTKWNANFLDTYDGGADLQMDNISDYLLLLSVYTSVLEDCRRRITDFRPKKESLPDPNFLCFLVCEVVENYLFLCLQIILNHRLFKELKEMPNDKTSQEHWNWFCRNITQLLYLVQHPIYKNTFYLLRSLSRSVSSVETFFVNCNSIKSTYDHYSSGPSNTCFEKSFLSIYNNIAQRFDSGIRLHSTGPFLACLLSFVSTQNSVGQAIAFFSSAKEGSQSLTERVRKELYGSTTMLLGCIANFCLDFGPFRRITLENETFLKDLAKLLNRTLRTKSDFMKDSKFSSSYDLQSEWQEISFEQLQIQIGVFQIIQNLLYNETEENRRGIWGHIPLTIIFEKSLYGISTPRANDPELHKLLLKLKVIAFAILRNTTVNSTFFCRCISGIYRKYALWQEGSRFRVPPTWKEYLLESLLAFDLYVPINKPDVEGAVRQSDEFLLNLLKIPEYHGLFVAITYLKDNCHINIYNFRASDLPSLEIMRYWKRILQIQLLPELERKVCKNDPSDRLSFSVRLIDAKLAIVWNLINLLFEDEAHSSFEEDQKMSEEADGYEISLRRAFGAQGISVPFNSTIETPSILQESSDPFLPVKARAEFIMECGFQGTLYELIHQMSTPWRRYVNSGKYGLLRRFDNINSNDLFDKLRTAYRQILRLGGNKSHESIDSELKAAIGDEVGGGSLFMDAIVEDVPENEWRPCLNRDDGDEDEHDESSSDENEFSEPWLH